MARPRRGQLKQVRIEALDPRGPGVAQLGDVPLRVPDTAPGDLVRVRLGRRGHSGWLGELLELLEPGAERRPPACPLAGRCGGCTWQHITPELQQRTRLGLWRELLDAHPRLAGLTVEDHRLSHPGERASREDGYRHRVKLPIAVADGGPRLGCYAPHSHQVIEAEHCLVHAPLLERLLAAVKAALSTVWPQAERARVWGALRTVYARVNAGQNQALLGLATRSELDLAPLWQPLRAQVAELVGLFQAQAAPGNSLLAQDIRLVAGRLFIEEQLGPLQLRVSAGAFSQVDPHAAAEIAGLLAQQVVAGAPQRVLDLYCGVGALGIEAARQAGVPLLLCERDAAMAQEAGDNARRNGVQAAATSGDVAGWPGSFEPGDAVIVNPPRKGLDPALLARLAAAKPKLLAYLSCRPQTMVRDLDALVAAGARVERLIGFDLFPQTVHIESLAVVRFG